MKEKKISFTHFHNQRLKEVTIGGVLVKPLYFRLIHNRKKTEIRTECFNYFIGLDSNRNDWIDIIIEIDKKIIEKSILISKKDKSFDFEIFKINYRIYSKNILPEYQNLLSQKTFDFLEQNDFFQLANSLRENQVNFNLVLDTLNKCYYHFLRIPHVEENCNRNILYQQSLAEGLARHVGNAHIIIEKLKKVININDPNRFRKTRSRSSIYISVNDWVEYENHVLGIMSDVALDKAIVYSRETRMAIDPGYQDEIYYRSKIFFEELKNKLLKI